MKVEKYIAIFPSGSARLTSNPPDLGRNEIAIRLVLEIPDALFEKPLLEAQITVPEEAAIPKVVESIVFDNVEEVLKDTMNLDFNIRVKRDED